MMLQALLRDLSDLPGVTLTVTRDARLPAIPARTIAIQQEPWTIWQHCIHQADKVWLIAPESGGMLEQLTRIVPPEKRTGCDLQSLQIASSKIETARLLEQHGIAAVPTWRANALPLHPAPWVAKPDDGAGCEDTRFFADNAAMQAWLAEGRVATHIIQPWLDGEPASLSMLCHQGQGWLLSANRQRVSKDEHGVLAYLGSVLNGMAQRWDAFAALAQQIAQALPGLTGYVGVDVVVQGDRVVVLEINPRLTTSYVGLRQATGLNPAKLMLDLLYNPRMMNLQNLQRNVVEIGVPHG